MDLIIYHNNCPDGWVAAYICKKRYPEAELVPLNHGLSDGQLDQLMNRCYQKDVLMVDYSLRTRELNDLLNSMAKSFRILDHHKTAQAALDGAEYATFDMKRSGAGLAWDYLFGGERPFWVSYTEDQDLWNWKLENSQEINAYLMTLPRTVESWDAIAKHDNVETANLGGIGVRKYIEYYTRSVMGEMQEGVFAYEVGRDLRTGVLNIPYVGVSEAGNAIVKAGYDLGLAWFERGDGVAQFSLRSKKGGDVDVSKIAQTYGGGGHQSAAGFQVSIAEGRSIIDGLLGRK